MKKSKFLILGMLAMVLALGLVVVGCNTDGGDLSEKKISFTIKNTTGDSLTGYKIWYTYGSQDIFVAGTQNAYANINLAASGGTSGILGPFTIKKDTSLNPARWSISVQVIRGSSSDGGDIWKWDSGHNNGTDEPPATITLERTKSDGMQEIK
jgi:hypothetical protein